MIHAALKRSIARNHGKVPPMAQSKVRKLSVVMVAVYVAVAWSVILMLLVQACRP